MARIDNLATLEDWQRLWEEQKAESAGRLLIFKRSPICPTSHFVEGIFRRFVSAIPDSPALRLLAVDVIGARPVSQRIAKDTGVSHESPQAILIGAGQEIIWNDSHGAIDDEALDAQLKK